MKAMVVHPSMCKKVGRTTQTPTYAILLYVCKNVSLFIPLLGKGCEILNNTIYIEPIVEALTNCFEKLNQGEVLL